MICRAAERIYRGDIVSLGSKTGELHWMRKEEGSTDSRTPIGYARRDIAAGEMVTLPPYQDSPITDGLAVSVARHDR